MAERIKETRDKTFETKNNKNHIVNRNMGIASLGSAALDNKECYIELKESIDIVPALFLLQCRIAIVICTGMRSLTCEESG